MQIYSYPQSQHHETSHREPQNTAPYSSRAPQNYLEHEDFLRRLRQEEMFNRQGQEQRMQNENHNRYNGSTAATYQNSQNPYPSNGQVQYSHGNEQQFPGQYVYMKPTQEPLMQQNNNRVHLAELPQSPADQSLVQSPPYMTPPGATSFPPQAVTYPQPQQAAYGGSYREYQPLNVDLTQPDRRGPSSQTVPHKVQNKKRMKKALDRTPSAPRSAEAPVSMRGYLYRFEGGAFKKWRRRFCILSNNNLYCYKNHVEDKTVKSILLLGYTIVECRREADGKVIRAYSFKAEHANMKTHFFAAETPSDFNQWTRAMQMAARVERSKSLEDLHMVQHQERQDRFSAGPAFYNTLQQNYTSPNNVQPNNLSRGYSLDALQHSIDSRSPLYAQVPHSGAHQQPEATVATPGLRRPNYETALQRIKAENVVASRPASGVYSEIKRSQQAPVNNFASPATQAPPQRRPDMYSRPQPKANLFPDPVTRQEEDAALLRAIDDFDMAVQRPQQGDQRYNDSRIPPLTTRLESLFDHDEAVPPELPQTAPPTMASWIERDMSLMQLEKERYNQQMANEQAFQHRQYDQQHSQPRFDQQSQFNQHHAQFDDRYRPKPLEERAVDVGALEQHLSYHSAPRVASNPPQRPKQTMSPSHNNLHGPAYKQFAAVPTLHKFRPPGTMSPQSELLFSAESSPPVAAGAQYPQQQQHKQPNSYGQLGDFSFSYGQNAVSGGEYPDDGVRDWLNSLDNLKMRSLQKSTSPTGAVNERLSQPVVQSPLLQQRGAGGDAERRDMLRERLHQQLQQTPRTRDELMLLLLQTRRDHQLGDEGGKPLVSLLDNMVSYSAISPETSEEQVSPQIRFQHWLQEEKMKSERAESRSRVLHQFETLPEMLNQLQSVDSQLHRQAAKVAALQDERNKCQSVLNKADSHTRRQLVENRLSQIHHQLSAESSRLESLHIQQRQLEQDIEELNVSTLQPSWSNSQLHLNPGEADSGERISAQTAAPVANSAPAMTSSYSLGGHSNGGLPLIAPRHLATQQLPNTPPVSRPLSGTLGTSPRLRSLSKPVPFSSNSPSRKSIPASTTPKMNGSAGKQLEAGLEAMRVQDKMSTPVSSNSKTASTHAAQSSIADQFNEIYQSLNQGNLESAVFDAPAKINIPVRYQRDSSAVEEENIVPESANSRNEKMKRYQQMLLKQNFSNLTQNELQQFQRDSPDLKSAISSEMQARHKVMDMSHAIGVEATRVSRAQATRLSPDEMTA